jgi:hypothetical protein
MAVSNAPLVKIQAMSAADICARFLLNREARALLGNGMAPGPFIEALTGHKQYIAGIEFLAHALPAREAIWWGCLCLQHACGNELSAPPDRAAATAAVQWVLRPGDSTRGAAKVQAEAAGLASVAGTLAMGAYQTGPGYASPGGPPIAAPPFGTAQAVANAVKLACTKSDPARIVETQRGFLGLGVGVAEGRFM